MSSAKFDQLYLYYCKGRATAVNPLLCISPRIQVHNIIIVYPSSNLLKQQTTDSSSSRNDGSVSWYAFLLHTSTIIADGSTAWPIADASLSQEILDLVQQASHYRESASFSDWSLPYKKHTSSRKISRRCCHSLDLCCLIRTSP